MKQLQAPPKLVVINDVAGFGRCSTSVALPVISVLGVQACLAPTALFSNHMGFPTWHFDDYTSQLPAYLDAWEKLSLHFDGIYIGFLGSDAQVSIVSDFLKKHPKSQIILDPVLGDHGKTYSSVTSTHCDKIRSLVKKADILTPNITEACLLTDTPFKESGWTKEELDSLSEKLKNLGPKKAVITGIREDDCLINYFYDTDSQQTGLLKCPITGQSRPGTGDIFASVLAADALKEVPFEASVQKAADFIAACIEGSESLNLPIREGVCFENYLSLLI